MYKTLQLPSGTAMLLVKPLQVPTKNKQDSEKKLNQNQTKRNDIRIEEI